MKIEKRELKNDSREENLDQLLFSSIIAEEVKANNTLDLGVDWSIIRTLKKKKNNSKNSPETATIQQKCCSTKYEIVKLLILQQQA